MATRIHALCTGSATVKEALRRGRGEGLRRRAAIFTDRRWSSPLPIHCWLIEHEEGPILVDAGALAGARDLPFVRMEVAREDEVDVELDRVGASAADLRRIVITHAHPDHLDGLARLPTDRVSIGEEELRMLRAPAARLARRVLGPALPGSFDPSPLRMGPAPFGAFARSVALTADGSVVAVPTPGHTPGHISVVVVIGERHYFLAGDATYDQAQLLAVEVDGLAPDARQARETMRRILRHGEEHRTVYLPSHDLGSRARLSSAEELRPA